jgi:hypothetical protein
LHYSRRPQTSRVRRGRTGPDIASGSLVGSSSDRGGEGGGAREEQTCEKRDEVHGCRRRWVLSVRGKVQSVHVLLSASDSAVSELGSPVARATVLLQLLSALRGDPLQSDAVVQGMWRRLQVSFWRDRAKTGASSRVGAEAATRKELKVRTKLLPFFFFVLRKTRSR